MVIRKVRAILDGENVETVLSPSGDNRKIVNFTRNLAGDMSAVTVDRWAQRIATDFADCRERGERPCASNGRHACGHVPTGDEYETIASAYRDAADACGVSPATMQAVTWCVVRGTGE
jgi:hypothetical protein